MIILTTILQVLAGLGAPLLIAYWIRQRHGISYALLIPGLIAGLGVQVLNPLVEGGAVLLTASVPGALSMPVLAGVIGFFGGLLAAMALLLTLTRLTPAARSFSQLVMVGLGFGGAEVAVRAVLAALLLIANMRLLERPPEQWHLPPEQIAARQADLDLYFARPVTEPLLEVGVALARLALGVALTVLMGRLFITGEIGWFFGTLFWAAVAVIGSVIFSRGGPSGALGWWALVGLVSVALLWRFRTPSHLGG